jgi:hypothetical protein
MCTLHLGESKLRLLGGAWNQLVGIQTIEATFRVKVLGGRGGG